MELLSEIFTWATGLIDSLSQLVTDSPITYLVLFALAAVDVLLPILPAEASITAAAVLAGQGTLNIVWVMVAAGLGAFLGDNVAYWIGRAAGRPLARKILRGDMDQLDDVQSQFDRRGGIFIIVGRFIPGGRTTVAIGAGVLRFKWLHFVVYDAIAAVAWSFQAALPGFIGGSIIQDRPWLALVFGFVLSGSLALGLFLGQRWWERRGHGPGTDATTPSGDPRDRATLKRRVVSRVTGVPSRLPGERFAASGDAGPDEPASEPPAAASTPSSASPEPSADRD